MKVTIEPHTGKSVTSGETVKFAQYRVRVDGKHAGFIGFAKGSKVLLHGTWTPNEQAQIEMEVSQLVGLDHCGGVQTSPTIPKRLQKSREADVDDFD